MTGAPENLPFDAIALSPEDNVANVLYALEAGQVARVRRGDRVHEITITQPIPFGHKVALEPIRQGAAAIKYGTVIGRMTLAVAQGEHVHIHNLTSARAAKVQD